MPLNPSCVLVAQSAGSTAEEAVAVNNPTATTWVALVDPFDVPSGSTTFDYVDAIANPAYGSVDVDNTPAALAAGGSATRAGRGPDRLPGRQRTVRHAITGWAGVLRKS